tara:strand:+ start:2193 stop:2363 length:171 start_codon:yes stop_codon:yes gene_type:complete
MNMTEVKFAIEDKMDELSHMLIEDYPTGYAVATTNEKIFWFDGYVAALELILEMIE